MDDLRVTSSSALVSLGNSGASSGAAFSDALASAGVPVEPLRAMLRAPQSDPLVPIGDLPDWQLVARRLDELERKRVEASTLPERIALGQAAGAADPDVVLAMHRQARLMAAYQIDVMWAARIVGATAGGIKQLITSA